MTVRKGGGARQPGDLSIAGSRFATDLGPVITYPAICTFVSLLSFKCWLHRYQSSTNFNSYSVNFFLWRQYLQRDPRVAWVCITGAGYWKCYLIWVMKQLVQDHSPLQFGFCPHPTPQSELHWRLVYSSVVYINHAQPVSSWLVQDGQVGGWWPNNLVAIWHAYLIWEYLSSSHWGCG